MEQEYIEEDGKVYLVSYFEFGNLYTWTWDEKLHREDGPAVISGPDQEKKTWYLYGEPLSKSMWEKEVAKIKNNNCLIDNLISGKFK